MKQDLKKILSDIDHELSPSLSSLVDIEAYIEKIFNNATIVPVYVGGVLVAFIAFYCNDNVKGISYLTMIAVNKNHRSKGLAKILIEAAVEYLKQRNFKKFILEVYKTNIKAYDLYKKIGFNVVNENEHSLLMEKLI